MVASEWDETRGGVTEHTLTWNASDFRLGITVKVNGADVTSPYTLANGEKITLNSAHTIAVNGTSYTEVTNLDLSNVDIAVTLGSGPNLYNTSPAITINCTA